MTESPKGGTKKFRYQLTYDEAYEAFYLLGFRRSKRFKAVTGTGLVAIIAVLLILFFRDPQKVHYFMIVIIALALLFYLIYVPSLKARRGAAQVAKTKGTYEVGLTDDGKIVLANETVPLKGDRNARAIETETVFAIRTDNQRTFCLPKRIMSPKDTERVREILSSYTKFIGTGNR